MKTKNILLVGVGGQGTILAGTLLTRGLIEAGFDVKMSEIHGMSQRGGSVSTFVRYGDKVYSPVVEKGTCDMIVAFEKLEAVRFMPYLHKDAELVVNDFTIMPSSVLCGLASYPDNLDEILTQHANLTMIDAGKIARELGNEKVMNVILLATIVKKMGLDKEHFREIIRTNVKKAFVEMNLEAFARGLAL